MSVQHIQRCQKWPAANEKLLPTWLISAGYSAWHFYGRHFLNKISLNWPLTLPTQPSTSKLSDNPAYLRLISANGAVFAIDLQIYLETSSLQ